MGALLDGDEHDVRYAHDTREQGKQTHYPKSGADDTDTLLHLQVLRETVPEPYCILVFRVCLMLGIQAATVAVFETLVSLLCRQSVEGELDASSVIGLGTIDALDGRIAAEHL